MPIKEEEFYQRVYEAVSKGISAYSGDSRAKILGVLSGPIGLVMAKIQVRADQYIDRGIHSAADIAKRTLESIPKPLS